MGRGPTELLDRAHPGQWPLAVQGRVLCFWGGGHRHVGALRCPAPPPSGGGLTPGSGERGGRSLPEELPWALAVAAARWKQLGA